jgi:protein-disulfide isomerase/uncharacterized membrane protein
VQGLCGEGEESGCSVVAASRYATVFGLPLAAVGLFFYLSLGSAAVLGLLAADDGEATLARPVLWLLATALGMDLFLLGVQVFSIGRFCSLCILTYGVTLVAFVVMLPAKNLPGRWNDGLGRSPGRLLLGGWVVTAVAWALVAVAGDASLSARAGERQAKLLHDPSPAVEARVPEASALPVPADPPVSPPPPAGVAVGSPAPPRPEANEAMTKELELYRSEVRKLQETLDDPKKLDQYLADKAARDFEQAAPMTFYLSGVPFKGPAEAPIAVVEFSDFLCPYCSQLAEGFRQFLPRSGNRIRIYFKNYPLDKECNPHITQTIHPGACLLARGAVCAAELGNFWPYHDRVFTKPPENPRREQVVQLARESGLDAARFGECLDSGETRERLAIDIADAHRVEVKATPTVFINGKKLPRIGDFLAMLSKEAARLGLPAANH